MIIIIYANLNFKINHNNLINLCFLLSNNKTKKDNEIALLNNLKEKKFIIK